MPQWRRSSPRRCSSTETCVRWEPFTKFLAQDARDIRGGSGRVTPINVAPQGTTTV